jgi:hypothetical protein
MSSPGKVSIYSAWMLTLPESSGTQLFPGEIHIHIERGLNRLSVQERWLVLPLP